MGRGSAWVVANRGGDSWYSDADWYGQWGEAGHWQEAGYWEGAGHAGRKGGAKTEKAAGRAKKGADKAAGGSENVTGEGAKPTSLLDGKKYKEAVEEVVANTILRITDLDQRAIQLFDYFQSNEPPRANEVCAYLTKILEKLTRDHVSNWRAYVYVLLRQFDKEAYKAMKDDVESRRSAARNGRKGKEKKTSTFAFNPDAVAFVPGTGNFEAVGFIVEEAVSEPAVDKEGAETETKAVESTEA